MVNAAPLLCKNFTPVLNARAPGIVPSIAVWIRIEPEQGLSQAEDSLDRAYLEGRRRKARLRLLTER
jgi:hypothetical protein